MKNKRGQDLQIGTIILIILGVGLLVGFIIFAINGFSWGKQFIPTETVSTVSLACNSACQLGSAYDYCTKKRDLFAEDMKTTWSKGVRGTCFAFSVQPLLSKYRISTCPDLVSQCGGPGEGDFAPITDQGIGTAVVLGKCTDLNGPVTDKSRISYEVATITAGKCVVKAGYNTPSPLADKYVETVNDPTKGCCKYEKTL